MAKAVISLLSDDEKENTPVHDVEPPREHSEVKLQSAIEPERKDVPSTPASRLALPDLIGMGDVRRPVQNVSPDERIGWDHDKDMKHTLTSSFGGIRRAKKRARSSSPTTSSPVRASPHINARGESVNPQTDPGSELWGRYSLNGSNMPTPQGAPIPALAHIMHTSSPQPLKGGATPRSVAGFRRANSCGNQFPKRRRVGGTEDVDVFTESTNIGSSKLSVLIERVQEGLTQPKPPLTENGSAGLSNHSLKRQFSDLKEESLTPRKGQEGVKSISKQQVPCKPESQQKQTKIIHPPESLPHSDSSDYGDDDFDDDELDATILESFGSKPEQPVSVTRNVPASKLPADPPPRPCPSEAQSRGANHSKLSQSIAIQPQDDEFDDSDEDIFAADLEHIVAKFDNQRSLQNGSISVTRPRKDGQTLKEDSDDEFGDGDLDEHDFREVEAKATQNIHQGTNSLLPVRTRFP